MIWNQRHKDKNPRSFNATLIGLCVIGFVVCLILFFLDPADKYEKKNVLKPFKLNQNHLQNSSNKLRVVNPVTTFTKGDVENSSVMKVKLDWNIKIKELFELGLRDSAKLAHILENDDVFGTINGPDNFHCPANDELLDYPSIVDKNSLEFFRSGDSFIFYQHLRKAGGTGFCDLALSNLPNKNVPSYYCMPDNRGSMATPPWNNMNYTMTQVTNKKYRIIANEWDTFSAPFLEYPNVVLATTIRHPIDRWYSQYRFEHLEHRDGSKLDAPRMSMLQWYKQCVSWTMGVNYYVKTFLGEVDRPAPRDRAAAGDFYWTYHKFNAREKQRRAAQKPPLSWEEFSTALHTLRRFQVLLVMEWLDSSAPFIEATLGWKVPPKQVLPHEVQAKRNDKKSKASREMLGRDEYTYLLTENVMDLLLFEITKRIYLERVACLRR
jgi:hypothetical protein